MAAGYSFVSPPCAYFLMVRGPLRRPASAAPKVKPRRKVRRGTPKYDFGGRLIRCVQKSAPKYAPSGCSSLLLLFLDEDIMGKILASLDTCSLGFCVASGSRALLRLSELNILWKVALVRLCRRGVFMPMEFKESLLIPLSVPRQGYWRSEFRKCILDSKRSYIKEDELCSFRWSFRFKQSAGRTWLQLDPWWQNTGPALQLRFNRDRTVEHIGRSLLGGPAPEFRWRFQHTSGSRHPSLRGKRPLGSFLRMSAPWGEFPTLIVRRAPNWGFVLESCWVLYTSFPLPKRGENKELEDESTVTGEMQEEDIERYNGDDDEEEDDEEEEDEDDEEASEEETGVPQLRIRL